MTDSTFTRVLYISPGGLAARGGMGSVARCLTEQFKAKPIACQVVDSYGTHGALARPFYFLAALGQLVVAAARQRVDVVHIHMSHGGSVYRKLILLRVACLFGVPVLLHIHGSSFEVFCEQLAPRRRRWVAANLGKASRIVVLGNHWRDYLVRKLHIDPEKITIVYNGVDVPATLPQHTQGDACRIVALGLLSKRKGTPELLQALASPAMRDVPWKALLAGNGEVDFYRAEAERLGIADRVAIPGWIDAAEARQHLLDADLLVLPSHNEGLPVAILEAMAAAVAVVTTPVGAIPELVLDHETGLLVPPGDAEALAAALVDLVSHSDKRRNFGRAGYQRVALAFTSHIFADHIARLYTELRKRA